MLEVRELGRVGRKVAGFGRQAASTLPVPRVPGHHAAELEHVADVLGPLGTHPVKRRGGAWDVTRGQARTRLLRAQRGYALRRRNLDRLGVSDGGVGLPSPVQELRQQGEERGPLRPVRVRERELRPLRAVAIGADTGGPLGGLCEQRNGVARIRAAEQVVGDRFGRSALRRKRRGGGCVEPLQHGLGQPGRQLLADQRVPKAVAAACALEHARRIGARDEVAYVLVARECDKRLAGEAVVDHGECGKEPLGRGLELLETSRCDLTQPRRDADLSGRVDRCGKLLGEERVPSRRALDHRERLAPERPPRSPPRDRAHRGAVEGAERQLGRCTALEQARAHERGGLRERVVAHGDDDEEPLAGGEAGDVMDECRGRLVRGRQVVDCEDHATLRGRLPEELRDRREDAVPVRGLLGPVGRVPDGGQQPRERGLGAVA
jgi:hypothetical protein